MPILALDGNTVKFLKTSQVITSVTYAVKELVENSLDADAKNIEVNLHDDGLTQIEVKDDGCGIPKEDAPCMALPSYTSKIKNFDDLEKLHTYGFRGEALHALCQVADVTIITKPENEEIATLYTLDSNGNFIKSEPCSRSTGTTIQINGLFKKMPVRRQSLNNSRRANQDLKYLETLLKSFGIIQPSLRITYRRNKQIVFIKASADNLINSIANVLGKDISSKLTLIEKQTPEGFIQLMLPKKDLKDPTLIYQSGHQYIFVNNRILIHKELEKLINKRIQDYFEKETPPSKKCLFVFNITLDPSDFDINLEPNKTKGFLKNEKEIIASVDKILVTFYNLEESAEEKKDNHNENLTPNVRNESNDDNNSEWPACKKRKVDINGKASVKYVDSSDNFKPNKQSNQMTKSPEEESFKMPLFVNVTELDLSESDSNSDEERKCHKKKRSITPKAVNILTEDSDMFDFNNSLPNQTNIHDQISQPIITPAETETFSQLPVVDLGEEFSQVMKQEKNKTFDSENLLSSTDFDTELLSLDLDDDLNLNETTKETKPVLKQSTLSLNTSEKGELLIEVDRNSESLYSPSPNSWSRGHVSGLESGTDVQIVGSGEKEHKASNLNGFNAFLSQVRPQIMKENPQMSVPQIASILANQWKEMSPVNKEHYKEMEKEKMKHLGMSKKAKIEKGVLEKNKNKLLELLKNMKSKKTDNQKNNETLRQRTTANMETNIQNLTKKFYRSENTKKNLIIIGPIKPSVWIAKLGSQFLLLNVAEMYKKLNFTEHNSKDANAETVEMLLNRWMMEKHDMSIMHFINSEN